MEVGEEGDCVYIYKTDKNQRKTASCKYIYTYRYTATTRMTSASRWAAMRAILMFH